jgi:4-hydroxy-3-methylbut-2-enyl diphosphate reductase IspH
MSMRPARWSPRCISRPSGTTANGLQMIMIGHAGHPETVGTMGQLPEGEVLLVETVEDVPTASSRATPSARLRHADDAERG